MPNLVHGLDAGEGQKPLRVGLSRQSNPTAIVHGNPVSPSYDDLGRQVMTLHQVRDLISTGSVTLTRVAESAVISGVASTLLDLIYVTGSNTSGVAIQVNFRYGTAGSIIDSMVIPATSVAQKQYSIPIPMSEVAQAITAQSAQTGDISDSPVTITMLAVQNV